MSITTQRAMLVDRNRLRLRREAAGWSAAVLADKIGVSRSFINHLESGKEPSCSAEIAEDIEAALALDPILDEWQEWLDDARVSLVGDLFRDADPSEDRRSTRARHTDATTTAMAGAYESGLTLVQVAERFGWSSEGVRQRFIRDGVPIRRRGVYPRK